MYDKQEVNMREYGGFSLTRTDPYGFWIIKQIKGQTPKSLLGSYTSALGATKAIDNYLENKETKDNKKSKEN